MKQAIFQGVYKSKWSTSFAQKDGSTAFLDVYYIETEYTLDTGKTVFEPFQISVWNELRSKWDSCKQYDSVRVLCRIKPYRGSFQFVFLQFLPLKNEKPKRVTDGTSNNL